MCLSSVCHFKVWCLSWAKLHCTRAFLGSADKWLVLALLHILDWYSAHVPFANFANFALFLVKLTTSCCGAATHSWLVFSARSLLTLRSSRLSWQLVAMAPDIPDLYLAHFLLPKHPWLAFSAFLLPIHPSHWPPRITAVFIRLLPLCVRVSICVCMWVCLCGANLKFFKSGVAFVHRKGWACFPLAPSSIKKLWWFNMCCAHTTRKLRLHFRKATHSPLSFLAGPFRCCPASRRTLCSGSSSHWHISENWGFYLPLTTEQPSLAQSLCTPIFLYSNIFGISENRGFYLTLTTEQQSLAQSLCTTIFLYPNIFGISENRGFYHTLTTEQPSLAQSLLHSNIFVPQYFCTPIFLYSDAKETVMWVVPPKLEHQLLPWSCWLCHHYQRSLISSWIALGQKDHSSKTSKVLVVTNPIYSNPGTGKPDLPHSTVHYLDAYFALPLCMLCIAFKRMLCDAVMRTLRCHYACCALPLCVLCIAFKRTLRCHYACCALPLSILYIALCVLCIAFMHTLRCRYAYFALPLCILYIALCVLCIAIMRTLRCLYAYFALLLCVLCIPIMHTLHCHYAYFVFLYAHFALPLCMLCVAIMHAVHCHYAYFALPLCMLCIAFKHILVSVLIILVHKLFRAHSFGTYIYIPQVYNHFRC